MSENRNRDYSKYDAMTTQELEEILRLDASAPEGEESDTELLLYVMGVLANRKRHNSTGKTALEAWESFQRNYLPEEEARVEYPQEQKPGRTAAPWLPRLIAVAAAVALVICIPLSARAFGWEEIWNIFARWARETFSFVSGEDAEITEPSPNYDTECESLQELLLKNNRDANLVPTWIPEGFVLDSIKKDITPVEEIYRVCYLNGDDELRIHVKSYVQEDPGKIEIDDDLLEIYEISGVEYYIFSNKDQTRAVWLVESYQCNIAGDLSVEELKMMIDSIGKG